MENNRYVSWKSFFKIILALILATGTPVCGAIAWGWSDYQSKITILKSETQNQIKDIETETQNQIKDVEIRLGSQVQRIENKVDMVLDYLIQHNDL